jgi:site-specific DNA-methyltransferase (adenine-specific)
MINSLYNKIILGDCSEVLKTIPNDSIDLIVTSPPYKDCDGFSYDLIEKTLAELFRIQSPNTLFFLNFGHLATDKFRPFKVCELALKSGYKLNDTIIWIKNHYKPIQGHKRLNNLTEFIFLLYKEKMPRLNRLKIGIPYVDISNAKRFNHGKNLKCGGNVWNIKYETITKNEEKVHNDRFPPELPEKCISLCGYTINVMLDPFCGSGTVCKVAKKLNINYIGIEKNKFTYDKILIN